MSAEMKTFLKNLTKRSLQIVAPGASPALIAQRFEGILRKLKKRVRLVALNTITRLKGASDRLPLPPAQLIVLVQGTTNVREFLTDGRSTAQGVVDVLRGSGVEIDRSMRVLDFGCGCGRVMRHLHRMTGAQFKGSDYNPQLVEWCQRNLRFGQFDVNGVSPPLAYEKEQFDLIYALSVFTHLSEDLQYAWMSELSRVLKPGGHLLMTTQGESFVPYMSEEDRTTYHSGGLVVKEHGPVGSNPFSTIHPPQYVKTHLPPNLALVSFVPETRRRGEPPSRLCWQDGYVLVKRNGGVV
jgi:2-polyprenyl-3-methyl-5-hydroxy-6-metoxy-1,4-benzoquinol methylase